MKHYTDHAANERTWLAWIRTAIAIIAFGFIIERFELFSAYLRASVDAGKASAPVAQSINPLALLLVLVGIAVIVFATWRFHNHQRMIEAENDATYRAGWPIIGLAALLVLVALGLAWLVL
ncbi:DUF202 domain-containing protein [Haliea sp. E17]|uniref:DUF202 domain-containing protein n=1 Tax=Haliea sp. E17 TaxID=3401576 RepID=UPI003AAFBFC3